MTALSAARDTPQYGEGSVPPLLKIPIAANTKIYQGSIVAIVAATGHATPGAATSTLRVAGRARRTYDNTGGAAAAFDIEVERGVFFFGSSDIVQADLFATAYVVDDQTISSSSDTGARPAAGKIIQVDSVLGVAVQLG